MREILLVRLAAVLIALAVVGACAALEEQAPAFDSAATQAQQIGGCIRLVCVIGQRPIYRANQGFAESTSIFEVRHCRPRAGRCERQ